MATAGVLEGSVSVLWQTNELVLFAQLFHLCQAP